MFYTHKYTITAHLDQVIDALWLTASCCSLPSLSSLILNVNPADLTAQLLTARHAMSRDQISDLFSCLTTQPQMTKGLFAWDEYHHVTSAFC